MALPAGETGDEYHPASLYLSNPELAELADDVLVVGSYKLPVHRAIVGLHSPVLCTAYSLLHKRHGGDAGEGPAPKRSRLDTALEGFSATAVSLLLRLMYTPAGAPALPPAAADRQRAELRSAARLADKLGAEGLLGPLQQLLAGAAARAPAGVAGGLEQLAEDFQLAADLALPELLAHAAHAAARALLSDSGSGCGSGSEAAAFSHAARLREVPAHSLTVLLGAVAGAVKGLDSRRQRSVQDSVPATAELAEQAARLGAATAGDICRGACATATPCGRCMGCVQRAVVQLASNAAAELDHCAAGCMDAAQLGSQHPPAVLALSLAALCAAVQRSGLGAAVARRLPPALRLSRWGGLRGAWGEFNWEVPLAALEQPGRLASPPFQVGGLAWVVEAQQVLWHSYTSFSSACGRSGGRGGGASRSQGASSRELVVSVRLSEASPQAAPAAGLLAQQAQQEAQALVRVSLPLAPGAPSATLGYRSYTSKQGSGGGDKVGQLQEESSHSVTLEHDEESSVGAGSQVRGSVTIRVEIVC